MRGVMNRDVCIDMINKLEEFGLITRKQADFIMWKRDKKEMKEFGRKK